MTIMKVHSVGDSTVVMCFAARVRGALLRRSVDGTYVRTQVLRLGVVNATATLLSPVGV